MSHRSRRPSCRNFYAIDCVNEEEKFEELKLFPGLSQFQLEKAGISVSGQYNLARKYIHRIVQVDSKFGKSSVTPLQQWLMELVNKEGAVQAEVFVWAAFQKIVDGSDTR